MDFGALFNKTEIDCPAYHRSAVTEDVQSVETELCESSHYEADLDQFANNIEKDWLSAYVIFNSDI